MINKKYNYNKYLYLFIAIFFTVSILYISNSYDSAFAKKNDEGSSSNNKDQLVVKTRIHLDNIDNISQVPRLMSHLFNYHV